MKPRKPLTKEGLAIETAELAACKRVIKGIQRLLKKRQTDLGRRYHELRDRKNYNDAQLMFARADELGAIIKLLSPLGDPPLRTHEDAIERLKLMGIIR